MEDGIEEVEMREVSIVTEHTHNEKKYYPGQTCMMEVADAELYANLVIGQRTQA